MRKSEVIATCLVNSNMIEDIEDAKHAVKNIFVTEFPTENFSSWDINMREDAAQNIINAVGCASRIDVRNFIEDLWEE